ncbi:MAG TPA: methyltransferase domain-containing protein [Candidatus Cottocaccamicrobium excrementipullorum]|nr:methyltransferase domain-containing protein [Candidatus Cottocaccamicrobium excrementipullorum]
MEGRTHCLVCKEPLPEKPVLCLQHMPASAQNIPDENQVKEDEGISLNLYCCPRCGLVQFNCPPVDYYRDVIRSGGYSTTMRALRQRQYSHLIKTYGLEGKKFLEAGCGQGEFLQVLAEFPVKAYGVEHKADLVEAAQKKGLNVWQGFTEREDTLLGEEGPYDVFLSFNFLEHQPDPGKMLDCIRNNLTPEGMGLITVPSLEYILQYDGYYELIPDHLAYYSFETLEELLSLHGFTVLEKELVNRDTCSVIVKRTDQGEKQASVLCGNGKSGKTPDFSLLEKSRRTIVREAEELRERLRAEKKTFCLWGASHQGFTLASTTCLGEAAEYIIDSAPFKQGRFAPASHVPIVPPEHFLEHPADVILIAAPGYTEEIFAAVRSRFGEKPLVLTMRSDHLEKL